MTQNPQPSHSLRIFVRALPFPGNNLGPSSLPKIVLKGHFLFEVISVGKIKPSTCDHVSFLHNSFLHWFMRPRSKSCAEHSLQKRKELSPSAWKPASWGKKRSHRQLQYKIIHATVEEGWGAMGALGTVTISQRIWQLNRDLGGGKKSKALAKNRSGEERDLGREQSVCEAQRWENVWWFGELKICT